MSSSLYYPEQASSEGDRFGISRRDLLVLGALGLAISVPRSAAAEPQGQLTWGVHVSLAPDLVRSGRNTGGDHSLHDHVRAARRDGETDAGSGLLGAQPRGILVRFRGRLDLRVRPAQEREIP